MSRRNDRCCSRLLLTTQAAAAKESWRKRQRVFFRPAARWAGLSRLYGLLGRGRLAVEESGRWTAGDDGEIGSSTGPLHIAPGRFSI